MPNWEATYPDGSTETFSADTLQEASMLSIDTGKQHTRLVALLDQPSSNVVATTNSGDQYLIQQDADGNLQAIPIVSDQNGSETSSEGG